MEDYINKYEQFESSIIYDFRLGDGGIGDCIKFFIFILELCIILILIYTFKFFQGILFNDKKKLFYKK